MFETNRHYKYCTRRVGQIFEKFSDITGIKVAPHKLRNSIPQYLYDRGMSLEKIQKFLGHLVIETAQIHARSRTKHLQDGMSMAFGKLEDRS